MKTAKPLSNWRMAVGLAAVFLLAFSFSSCSDSDSPTEPVAEVPGGTGSGGGTSDTGGSGSGDTGGGGDGSTTEGTLAINMIDDPTDEICELWVYIRDLRVKPDGQSQMLLGTDIGAFELLELREGPGAPLGTWTVDAGTYQFIEMLLDESQSYVIEVDLDDPGDDPENPNCLETPTDLQIPSNKFKINGGPFSVANETTVTIDFDAKNSLKRKGSQNNPKGWQLNPKVSIVDVDEE